MDGDGRLNCVMRIAEDTVEVAIAAGLVNDGIARQLSLGYSVDVAHTGQKMQAGAKRVIEVSLVRKGCLIFSVFSIINKFIITIDFFP